MKNDQVENICRSCMCKKTDMISIFNSDSFSKTDSDVNHAHMLMAFTSVQVSLGDGLPESVCPECADQINQCYSFKLKCENTDKILRKKIELETNEEFTTLNYDSLAIKLEDGQIKQEDYQCDFYDNFNDNVDCNDSGSDDNSIKSEDKDEESSADEKKRSKKPPTKNRRNKFKCDVCRKSFRYEQCFHKHMEKKHSSEKNRMYFKRKSKRNILKTRNKVIDLEKTKKEDQENSEIEAKFQCDKCKSKFTTEDLLTKHISEKHLCTICMKQVRHLNIHLRSHTGEKAFLCAQCGKGFSQLAGYNEHMLRHSGIKSFTCETCEMSFITKGALVSHSLRHSSAKIFQCDVCSAVFHRPRSLQEHKKFIHDGNKGSYECDICHQTFGYPRSLRRHKIIHSGIKPYSCNFCEKTFTQKTTLTAHIRVHTGEKPYFCKMCGQCFGQRCSLRSHKIKENH